MVDYTSFKDSYVEVNIPFMFLFNEHFYISLQVGAGNSDNLKSFDSICWSRKITIKKIMKHTQWDRNHSNKIKLLAVRMQWEIHPLLELWLQ